MAIGIATAIGCEFTELYLDIPSADSTTDSDKLVARTAVEFICSVWNCDLVWDSEKELVTISERNLGL